MLIKNQTITNKQVKNLPHINNITKTINIKIINKNKIIINLTYNSHQSIIVITKDKQVTKEDKWKTKILTHTIIIRK